MGNEGQKGSGKRGAKGQWEMRGKNAMSNEGQKGSGKRAVEKEGQKGNNKRWENGNGK